MLASCQLIKQPILIKQFWVIKNELQHKVNQSNHLTVYSSQYENVIKNKQYFILNWENLSVLKKLPKSKITSKYSKTRKPIITHNVHTTTTQKYSATFYMKFCKNEHSQPPKGEQ